jgi:hypothetical protein
MARTPVPRYRPSPEDWERERMQMATTNRDADPIPPQLFRVLPIAGDAAFTALIASFLISTLIYEVTGLYSFATFGPYQYNAFDLPIAGSFVFFVYGLIARRKSFAPAILIVLGISTLLLVNFLRGILVSPGDSFNWLRSAAFLILGPLCVICARANSGLERRVIQVFTACALLLSALIFLRLAFGVTLFSSADLLDLAAKNEGRPISVNGTITMNIAVVLLLAQAMRERWRIGLVRLAVLLVIVAAALLTRQGTATICLIAGVTALFAFEKGISLPFRATVIVTASALGLFLSIVPPEAYLSADMQENMASRLNNRDTRKDVWEGFQRNFDEQDSLTQAIGFAANEHEGYLVNTARFAKMWKIEAHSMYYGMLGRGGYAGLALYLATLLALLASFLVAITRKYELTFFTPAVGLSLLIQLAILGYSYEVRNDELLLLLLCLLTAKANLQDPATASS